MIMSDSQDIEMEKIQKKYDVSLQIRNFEIELFWKRSNFFWLFVAACFAAFGVLFDKEKTLSVVIANIGMVCSFGWSLANRGSKYWQENWEQIVVIHEKETTGELFGKPCGILAKGCWLQARRYSVSKIAIALSDFICLTWFGLVAYTLSYFSVLTLGKILSYGFSVWSLLFMLVMCRKCKSSL